MKELAEILAILLKYDPEGRLSAVRDTIYIGPWDKGSVSAEDLKRLGELKCHWDEDVDSWFIYTQ